MNFPVKASIEFEVWFSLHFEVTGGKVLLCRLLLALRMVENRTLAKSPVGVGQFSTLSVAGKVHKVWVATVTIILVV